MLRYHEEHPEMNYPRLGQLFGITRQRVSQIIKRNKRDRMVVEYLKTYPGASPAEVGTKFGIRSVWRVCVLMQEPEH